MKERSLSTKTYQVETIKKILLPYLKKKPEVLKVILFGSLAIGEASRRSDIDLVFIIKSKKSFLKRYDDFMELFALFPYAELDFFLWTPEELAKMKNRPFVRRLLQEGIVLYEQDQVTS